MADQTNNVDNLFEMEKTLAADQTGAHKTKVLQQLTEAQAAVSQAISAGAAPAEFQRLNKMKAALETAHEVVEGVPGKAP